MSLKGLIYDNATFRRSATAAVRRLKTKRLLSLCNERLFFRLSTPMILEVLDELYGIIYVKYLSNIRILFLAMQVTGTASVPYSG